MAAPNPTSPPSSHPSHPTHRQPHLLAIPFPFYGHIAPLLQLCEQLASNGFAITFVNTLPHHPMPPSSSSSSDIRFVPLPDGLIPDIPLVDFHSFRLLLHAFEKLEVLFRPFVEKLASEASPPFSFVLSDVHLGWTQDLANSLGLPRIALWTSNVSELTVYFHVPRLISKGCLPFKGQDGFLTQPRNTISDIPGLPPLEAGDFPSFLQIEDASDILFRYFVDQTRRIPEADRVLVNSFYELEGVMFEALREDVPKVFPIGPLILGGDNGGVDLVSGTAGQSTEDIRIMEWLDTQAASSMIYVSFGSTVPIENTDQIVEFALGLEASGHPFLWVIRAGLVGGGSDPLPEGYAERVKGRGLIVSWAPQRRVLSHVSVGGFLTHCGWNSTLESVCGGVPMLCYPVLVDQTLTCKLVVDEWRVGLRLGKGVGTLTRAKEVETKVRELMGEAGERLRERCGVLREQARKCVKVGGLSYANLSSIFHEFTPIKHG